MLRELRDWLEEMACRAGFDGIPSPAAALKPAIVAVVVGLAAWAVWGGSCGASSAGPVAAGSRAATETVASRPTSDPALPAAPASITVHVVGEVRHPGVYQLAGGARAIDAVNAAGGLLGDAQQSAVNLARVVADGEQIAVPREGEAVASAGGAGGAGATSPGSGKVDINAATAEQLDALPGIGPATAAKIISDRTSNGPFKNVDDLMRVPGIGPSKFDALKDLIRTG